MTGIYKSWIKSNEEIEIMKKAGEICAQALKKVLENVQVGVSCRTLDLIAQEAVEKRGAKPSFKTVEDYKYTICTTVNEQIVHGIPSQRILREGDIIGIDIGALYKGYHSDLAITVPVGKVSKSTQKFISVGKKVLNDAISKAKPGNKIGDISAVIQKSIEGAGYAVVRELTGHGVGRELHEEPLIPGYGQPSKGATIAENMTLAIEVIYTAGSGEIILEKDNWTISSKDGSLGGLFEQTIQTSKTGPIVLTPYL